MKRIKLDKIASVTARLQIERNAVLSDDIPAREGTVIAGRILNSKRDYDKLEDVHGRMVRLHPGDIIAGALGHRDALYGYSGHVPETVATGDHLQVLNLGGVIGTGARAGATGGEPFQLEVLGSVLTFPHVGTRVGVPANVGDAALPAAPLPAQLPPVIALIGTCMDSGKTTAASVLIGELTRAGRRIAAGKLTGVSLRRDVLDMADCGAAPVAVFTDFGVVTTSETTVLPAARSLLAHLSDSAPDLIVLEMGDGLLGTYGVNALLNDAPLRERLTAIVMCAQDPVGAWGGRELLRTRYGLDADLYCGRVTDTDVGVRFCNEHLEAPAFNALNQGPALAQALADRVWPSDQPAVGQGATS